jgi:hypothetical protein
MALLEQTVRQNHLLLTVDQTSNSLINKQNIFFNLFKNYHDPLRSLFVANVLNISRTYE